MIGEPKSRYKCMALICQVCSIPFDFADTEQKVIEYDWKKNLGKYKNGKKNVDKQEIKVYNDDVSCGKKGETRVNIAKFILNNLIPTNKKAPYQYNAGVKSIEKNTAISYF